MAAISTAIAAIGVATSAYGVYSSQKSASKSDKNARARAAALDPLFAKQDEANQKIIENNKKMEAIKFEQARNDMLRAQRNIIRQTQLTQSVAATRASNQGALSSSSYLGAQAQIAGQSNDLMSTLASNFKAGSDVFAINQNIFDLQTEVTKAQSQINKMNSQPTSVQDFGRSIMQGGQLLTQAAPTIGNVATSLFSRPAETTTGWNTTTSFGN